MHTFRVELEHSTDPDGAEIWQATCLGCGAEISFEADTAGEAIAFTHGANSVDSNCAGI